MSNLSKWQLILITVLIISVLIKTIIIIYFEHRKEIMFSQHGLQQCLVKKDNKEIILWKKECSNE